MIASPSSPQKCHARRSLPKAPAALLRDRLRHRLREPGCRQFGREGEGGDEPVPLRRQVYSCTSPPSRSFRFTAVPVTEAASVVPHR